MQEPSCPKVFKLTNDSGNCDAELVEEFPPICFKILIARSNLVSILEFLKLLIIVTCCSSFITPYQYFSISLIIKYILINKVVKLYKHLRFILL